jgi:acyl CoA:acetate/3-ketoacid CoA transferase beta subunit
VSAIATDMGVFERRNGQFVLAGIPAGVDRLEHLAAIEERLAWPLEVADDLEDLPTPSAEEVLRLRTWDPQGLFLRA